jgi:hypothetical protein
MEAAMKSAVLLVGLFVIVPVMNAAADDKNCKIVERDGPLPGASHQLSTSVQAGNGTVSAQSTGPNGVTMHSGGGAVSSSVTTGSGGQSQTVTTNSDGSCTIYRNKGAGK